MGHFSHLICGYFLAHMCIPSRSVQYNTTEIQTLAVLPIQFQDYRMIAPFPQSPPPPTADCFGTKRTVEEYIRVNQRRERLLDRHAIEVDPRGRIPTSVKSEDVTDPGQRVVDLCQFEYFDACWLLTQRGPGQVFCHIAFRYLNDGVTLEFI